MVLDLPPIRATPENLVIGIISASLVFLSWFAVVAGPSVPMSGMIDAVSMSLFVAIWAVGMVAMMLPSLIPMVFIMMSASGRSHRREGDQKKLGRILQPLQFALGYFGIWLLVGVAAYLGIAFLFLYYPSFSASGALVGVAAGIALFLAGLYQFSPLKKRALEACRSPMDFVMTRWRSGQGRGLLMGVDYGFFCTRCCWAFMAVLVVVGAMSALWMIFFTGVIFVEKVAPRGKVVSGALGVVMMAGGAILAAIGSA